ncbi:MAG: MFS transporter [Acidimicrobiales bacterium]
MGVRRDLLNERSFIVYFFASFVSNIGTFMQGLGVPFVLYRLTGSNAWVGAGVLANWAASLLVTPAAGLISDRLNRRIILMYSNAVQLLAAAGLWLLAQHDALTPSRMLVPLVVGGLAAGFQYAPSQALLPLLVPHEHRVAGIRMFNVQFTLARAIGPALAGLVLHQWGVRTTFAVNALSFVAVLVALLFVRERETERARTEGEWHRQFIDGARYLLHRPVMARGILTAFVIALCGSGTVQLAAGIAAEIFRVDSDRLGLLVAAFGVGASSASVCLLLAGARWRRSVAALFGAACYAAGILVVVSTQRFAIGALGFAIMGTGHVCGGTSIATSLHAQVDERYRGRLTSFYLIALLGGSPIGALLWGALGDSIGLRSALCCSAGLLLSYLVFVVVRFDRLRGLDSNTDVVPASVDTPVAASARA